MNYPVWQLSAASSQPEPALLKAGCGPLLARVLAARGLGDPDKAAAFLGGGAPLSDPYLLKDMDRAVARIRQAVENGEPIVIFGDYDVDGICATAILYEHLTSLGAQVRCKLPSRDAGGYGISSDVLDSLAAKGYTLVVTVDNGISAIAEAAHAKELGIDLVITDHHLPPDALPDAVAVVDPQRADDGSPFKFLCGAGVAFKLCAALEECDPAELLEPFGELAAMGTIADVMPLTGENRTLVREGLAVLRDTMRPGLQALLESCGYAERPITADTVSFGLAPRLNAAGRMEDASVALKLLLCENEEQATGIAARLAEINTARQSAEQQIFAAAQAQLAADPARARGRVIVVAGDGWHGGVIGIVASRLCEQYGRPVIVITLQDGEGRGSGRAPSGFNLHAAIAACSGYLIRFGGHAAAAGLLIEEEKLPAFTAALERWARAQTDVPAPPTLALDAAVTLGELTLPAVRELERLAPYGSGNAQPLLLIRDAVVDGIWPMGSEGRHTRVRLRQGGDTLFVSFFGTAPQAFAYPAGSRVDAAVEVSVYEGRSGPVVSAHGRALRPAGLGNTPAGQAALFAAFADGSPISAQQARCFLPQRADTVALYRRIRQGSVLCGDLQPVFAAAGAENTGKVLASLTALEELGLVQREGGRYLPSPVEGKRDLASAPVLQRLERLAGGDVAAQQPEK